MKRAVLAVLGLGMMMGAHAFAQGAPQTAGIVRVDPQTVATGFRASKIVGGTVVNDADETVGTVDDLIITPSAAAPFAVLSVGGFLGLGPNMFVVPFASLQVKDKTPMILPGATKDSLMGLPEFKYAA